MKRTLYILPFFLSAVVFLSSCEETITLDLNQTSDKLVIEGLVADRSTHNYVKISRTSGFYSQGQTPRVTDASVMVEDDAGNMFSFLHNPNNHPDSAGYYLSETPFAGVINRTYKLTVVADGQTYEAQDKLLRLVPMDKLDYRINQGQQADPNDEGRFYELQIYVKEPRETKDYYLFKCFRNGKLEYGTETDIYFADDELIGENIDGIPLPVFYAVNDQARVEVFSLSREAFIFYRDLQKLLTNDGGMFGTPAANPRTNLSNGALGYFQASAMQVGELVIE